MQTSPILLSPSPSQRTDLRVEAQDLVTDAGRAAGPDLVQVAQHVQPGPPAAVVQLAVRQHAEQGGLADVGVTQHGQSQVDRVAVVRYLVRSEVGGQRSGSEVRGRGSKVGGKVSKVRWGQGPRQGSSK